MCNLSVHATAPRACRAWEWAANPLGPGYQSRELGSGVIIDKAKGYVVTNYHVVKEADRILVRLGPGDDVTAQLVGCRS